MKDQAIEPQIVELSADRRDEALSLAWKVFSQFNAPEYPPEGAEEFRRSLRDKTFIAQHQFFGAFVGDRLAGMAATRNEGSHIAFFFVEKDFHRRGIGRLLLQTVRELCATSRLTVNSTPFALPIYRRLGFVSTAPEQCVHGIRFTPMELDLSKG